MELYRRALRELRELPDRVQGDTVVAVRIGQLTFRLVFDQYDLVGCRPHHPPAADACLSVSSDTARDVLSGATTGSAAAMSGRVRIDGDPAVLTRLGRLTPAPQLRAHLARVSRDLGQPAAMGTGRDLVVVLGAPNDAAGTIGPAAMGRCVAAVDLCRRTSAALVLCGGYGAHFNTTALPHWRHCAAWIASRLPDPVLGGLESRHTYEDLLLSRELVDQLRPRAVTVVTSDYHLDRASFVARAVLPAARMVAIPLGGVDPGERERLRRHEEKALAETVAAALVFGTDRLPAAPTSAHEGGRIVLRPGS